jgi:hypothetical protein
MQYFYYLRMTILLIGGGAKGGELRRMPIPRNRVHTVASRAGTGTARGKYAA